MNSGGQTDLRTQKDLKFFQLFSLSFSLFTLLMNQPQVEQVELLTDMCLYLRFASHVKAKTHVLNLNLKCVLS